MSEWSRPRPGGPGRSACRRERFRRPRLRASRLALLCCAVMLCASCAAMRPNPRFQTGSTGGSGDRAADPVTVAERYLGVPYRLGGENRRGMDCSGLVLVAFREARSLKLPRNSGEQFSLGRPVGRRALKRCDLVFFRTGGGTVNHVGIYAGGGRFIHAAVRRGVCWESLATEYWSSRWAGARRLP